MRWPMKCRTCGRKPAEDPPWGWAYYGSLPSAAPEALLCPEHKGAYEAEIGRMGGGSDGS